MPSARVASRTTMAPQCKKTSLFWLLSRAECSITGTSINHGPDVCKPVSAQRVVARDVAFLFTGEVLCLVRGIVWVAVYLVLLAKDVVVWDLVRSEEAASVHVADHARRASADL